MDQQVATPIGTVMENLVQLSKASFKKLESLKINLALLYRLFSKFKEQALTAKRMPTLFPTSMLAERLLELLPVALKSKVLTRPVSRLIKKS